MYKCKKNEYNISIYIFIYLYLYTSLVCLFSDQFLLGKLSLTYHYHTKHHYRNSIYNMVIFHAPPISWKDMNLDHLPPYSTPFGNVTCSTNVKEHPLRRGVNGFCFGTTTTCANTRPNCQPTATGIHKLIHIKKKNAQALLIHGTQQQYVIVVFWRFSMF